MEWLQAKTRLIFLILWHQSEYSQGWFLTIVDVAFEHPAPKVGHVVLFEVILQTSVDSKLLLVYLLATVEFIFFSGQGTL